MPNRIKSLVTGCAVPCTLAALAALTGCRGAGAQRSQPPVPVTTEQASRKTVALTVRAIGRVEPMATVAVKARIGGELTKVHFAEGQNVRAGELLFTIDPRQYEAALRQAEAQLARTVALQKKAEADVARYADLVAKDFVTKEQYDQILATAASAHASADADRASADNARLQLSYCTITTPIGGRLGDLMVKTGNLIKANDDKPLVTINQVKPIFVTFTIPARHLSAIAARRGQPLEVKATIPDERGDSEAGTLSFVDNAVDATTSTVLLKATFPNERERLWAGQFVDVVLTLGEETDRVVVPAPAVQTGQQGDYVFVVKSDASVELRPVEVARRDESEAVIASGLEGEETVVTDGQLRLVAGSKVAVKSAAQASGSPVR